MENPGASVQSGIPVPVQVKIKNFGTDTLTSTAITYELGWCSLKTHTIGRVVFLSVIPQPQLRFIPIPSREAIMI